MGTVSFIEPTRPEYKILAVHFRDEITHPAPFLDLVAGVFGNWEGLGRDAWTLVARSAGEEGGKRVAETSHRRRHLIYVRSLRSLSFRNRSYSVKLNWKNKEGRKWKIFALIFVTLN